MNIGEKLKGYQSDAPESFPPDETDKTIILRENFRLSGSARFPVPDGFVGIEITNGARAVSITCGYERKIVK